MCFLTREGILKTKQERYRMKNSMWPRLTTEIAQNTKWPSSDDFLLRNRVIQEPFQTKSVTFVVACAPRALTPVARVPFQSPAKTQLAP